MADTPTPTPGGPQKASQGGLKRKIGPLPLWGWGLAAFGVAGAYFYLHRSGTGSSSDTGTTTGQPIYDYGNLQPPPTTTPTGTTGGGSGTDIHGYPASDIIYRWLKDPAGHLHWVGGYGHWAEDKWGKWHWEFGTLKPGQTTKTLRPAPPPPKTGSSNPKPGKH